MNRPAWPVLRLLALQTAALFWILLPKPSTERLFAARVQWETASLESDVAVMVNQGRTIYGNEARRRLMERSRTSVLQLARDYPGLTSPRASNWARRLAAAGRYAQVREEFSLASWVPAGPRLRAVFQEQLLAEACWGEGCLAPIFSNWLAEHQREWLRGELP